MAPDEQRMPPGPLAFVDGDADNLQPGNLLGLPRRAHSFSAKGRRAVVEPRDRKTLAASDANYVIGVSCR